MSIAGPLYRRSPRLFSPNKPGDWTFVWCELHENGEFLVFADPPQTASDSATSPSPTTAAAPSTQAPQQPPQPQLPLPAAAPTRKLLSIAVSECDIAHVRSDGRDSFEITFRKGGKKETFASHESSYDVDWWMNTLLAVKRDLEHGVRPRLSIVCPPNTAETEPTRSSVRSSMRRPPSSTNMTGSINRSGLHRRQPTLEASVTRFERFTIYETPALFYVVCSDRHYTRFRILSLNRAIERPTSLAQVLTEDPELYTWTAMEDKLQVLAEQCRVGDTKLIRAFTAVAIVGCIRFLRGYHFTFVTQRRKIGCIGGNFIYGISATQQLSVCMPNDQETITGSAWTWFNRWINPSPEEDAEARYLVLFHFIDLTKDFFFSYSYDVTHTLQHNMTTDHHEPAEMFTWNEYLTRELKSTLSPGAAIDLILPIVLGSYEQRKCSVFGRLVSITLLARRSRHYAGTRYLKRGVADTGKVGNDVETEQIIEDESMGAGKFSSFVQYRGSIPVIWSQETSATLPKPPIILNRVDPTYSASRKHFMDLFARYGSPIVALNLVKQSEKKEREVIVGNEFMNAVEYLNCFIPPEHRIRYVALDYSRLSKQKGLNVLHSLDKVAVWALTQTGFFCSAPKRRIGRTADNKQSAYVSFASSTSSPQGSPTSSVSEGNPALDSSKFFEPPPSPTIPRKSGDWLEQKGVLRTNCIDCLDRTNVSQFSVGMRALGQQLYAMGIRNTPLLESRSQLVRVLMLLYSLVGDAISMQYGGSEAHKNVKNSAGRENVKHRELLTSIRRYYSNSFTDMAKQDAINIFLGHFVPQEGEPPLWELDSDYYLHNFEVPNGVAACDQVRATLAKQEENKRKALRSVPSAMDFSALDDSEYNEDANDYQARMAIKDIRRREAYVQECKRLLEDWWRNPLEQFERPKFCESKTSSKPVVSSKTLATDRGSAGSDETESTAASGGNADTTVVGHEVDQPNRLPSTGTSDTFLQMYHPEELTSFDKTLGYKFMSPMDLSNELSSGDRPRTRTASNMDSTTDSLPGRAISADEVSVDLASVARTSAQRFKTRGLRSMSVPDASEDLDHVDFATKQKRHVEFHSKPSAIDENSLSGKFPYGHQPALFNRSMTLTHLQHSHVKSVLKRKDEQMSIDDFVSSRCSKHFIGDCSPQAADPLYERYVHRNQPHHWERDSESVKNYFESYLRDNNVSEDDARTLRENQVRSGATFKLQIGPYAGLDQNVKARMLVAKKLKTEPEDRRIFDESLNYEKLMSSHNSTIPKESIDLYQSFFDEPLPEVMLDPNPSPPVVSPVTASAAPNPITSATAEMQLSEELRKLALASQQKLWNGRGRYGGHELISVGPLLKLGGGKDHDFILFNEAAAENAFANVIKNETELSFYAKGPRYGWYALMNFIMKRGGNDSSGGGARGAYGAKERRDGGAGDARGAGSRRSQSATLRVPDPRRQREPSTRVMLSQPREIAYFSKYADDRVEFDRSNLLKYRTPPVGADLLDGIESYTPKDESDPSVPPAPLTPLLNALDHFKDKLPHAPQFVTYRNNLNKILGTPYNTSNAWALCAEKRDGCVYLDVRRTQDELDRNSRPLPQNQADAIYAGRRFELYATEEKFSVDSDHRARRVSQEEEYCGLFSLKLAETRLIVAAEIDCYDAHDDRTGNYAYVELKTTRVLKTDKDRYSFERYKLLSFWIQSFIVGTPRIVCGFRDDQFQLQKLQSFTTTEIPSFCRKHWDPQVCLGFADTLLQWVFDTADEGRVYDVTYRPREHRVEMREQDGGESFLPPRRAAA